MFLCLGRRGQEVQGEDENSEREAAHGRDRDQLLPGRPQKSVHYRRLSRTSGTLMLHQPSNHHSFMKQKTVGALLQARQILLEYKSLKMSENISSMNLDSSIIDKSSLNTSVPLRPKWTASKIEKYSRILFPTSFCVFQVLYWIYYNIKENEQES